MPEKVTSLNGLKVILEYGSHKLGALNSLYEEKNLKSAAYRLSLTVPPITRMMKLTEEWFGNKLFVIERNKIKPTPLADELYNKIIPVYLYLDSINKKDTGVVNIYSPHPYSSLATDAALENILKIPPGKCNFLYRSEIKPTDDLFITYIPLNNHSSFTQQTVELQLNGYYLRECMIDKSELPIYCEEPFSNIDEFKCLVKSLHNHGYKGKIIFSNNYRLMIKLLFQGECIVFGIIPENIQIFETLPIQIPIKVYCYLNNRIKNYQCKN
ncbi:helix-turn-helix domain-containing protein [Klebsiella aerogenes]